MGQDEACSAENGDSLLKERNEVLPHDGGSRRAGRNAATALLHSLELVLTSSALARLSVAALRPSEAQDLNKKEHSYG